MGYQKISWVGARVAIHYARGEIDLGDQITVESLTRSRFRVAAIEERDTWYLSSMQLVVR